MKKILFATTAVAAIAALALSGCTSRTETPAGGEGAGFDANSLIGVALPSKTSDSLPDANESVRPEGSLPK